MFRLIALTVLLGVFWSALSGQYANVQLWVAAVVSVLATILLCRRMNIVDDEGQPIRGTGAWLGYLTWLAIQIVRANIDVARIVWAPKLRIDPHFARLPHDLMSARAKATYANSITLTPGTVTVDLTDDEVLVHALTSKGSEDLSGGDMLRRIARGDYQPDPVKLPARPESSAEGPTTP